MLFAMTMASALAVGGAFVTRELAASARSALRGSDLEPAAERVLVDAIVSWDSASRAQQGVGVVSALPPPSSVGVRTDAWITRLSGRTYWLVAQSESGVRPSLRRRIGVVIQLSDGAPQLVPLRAWSELP
jgi:hypothetical protein